MPYRISPISYIAALGLFALAPARAETVVNVANYGAVANSGMDATSAFKQAITAVKAATPPVTLLIPPGRYDFFRSSATVRNCYTSNSTEAGTPERHIALDLTDIDDLTLHGPGATLMMGGQMTMLVAERCHGLTLRGLEFDFERPTFSEITAVEKTASYWVGQVHPDSDYQIVNGNRLNWIGDGVDTGYDQIQRYDPATRSVTRNNNDPIGSPTAITDLGAGRLRFTGGGLGNVTTGITYQFRRARRNELGMWFNRCSNVTMEDVAVRAMHGFGILAQFTENVTYKRLTVAPKPGSGRTCASPADILHFSGCKGTVRILDSQLAASHDDAMNVHGTHLCIVAQPAPKQLRVKFMHHQSWGFEAFVPGDEIELVRPTTLLSYGNAVVESVQKVSDYEQLITLDRAVTGVTLNSDAVENVTWTPAVEMINCDLSQIPTRGILLTTRRPILIQGNRFFRTAMNGILIEDDAAGWYESGPVNNLTVSGNSFYECAEQVIRINPENTTHGGAVHKNILVKDNDFFLSGNGAAYAKSTDNLRFEGNRFHMRNGTSPAASSLVSTSNTTGISFTGNVAAPASQPALALTDSGFELPDVAPTGTGAPASWFVAGNAVVTGEGLSAAVPPSQFLSIESGAATFQQLGCYDPAQGSNLNWSLKQVRRGDVNTPSGPCELRFFAWNGVFIPTDGAPSGSGMRQLGAAVPISPLGTRDSRVVRGSIDLSNVAAGTRVWMEIRASGTVPALLDEMNATVASQAASLSFSGWISECGLAGEAADPMADPDGDGVVNLLEFALDARDPTYTDSFPALEADNTTAFPAFRIRPRAGALAELRPQFQQGGMLANGWQDVEDGVGGVIFTSDGSGWLVGVTAPIPPRMFFRLSAELTAPPLLVTGGDFGANNLNGAQTPDWFESGGTNWVEGAWMNSGTYPVAYPAASGAALLMDNLGDGSYVYQKIGVLQQAHINAGVLRVTASFIEKPDGNTNSARFDVYAGSFPGAADGNDIFNAGLQNIGTLVLDPTAQGLTAASGNESRNTDRLVGNVSLTGLSAGSEIWLRITDAADGTDNSGSGGDLIIDDVKVEVVSGS